MLKTTVDQYFLQNGGTLPHGERAFKTFPGKFIFMFLFILSDVWKSETK